MHNRQNDYAYRKRQSTIDWEWVDNEWRWENRSAETNGDIQNLGFGEYFGWTYVDVLTHKQAYVDYLTEDKDEQCPQKQKSPEWVRWEADGIIADVNTGAVE